MNRSFGSDHAELGQVPAERVDGLGALANQQVPRAKHDGGGLLVRAFEGHKAHSGPLSGLADRFGIGHVVLLPLDERLHVRRRDQLHRVAKLGDLAPPIMRAATRLHGHRARRQCCQEREKLAAAQFLAKDHRARAVSPMELKDVLGEIEADGANLVHERLLEWPATPSLWHTTAAGGVHTITALAAVIPLCDAASARGPKPTQPGLANSQTVSMSHPRTSCAPPGRTGAAVDPRPP